MQTLAWKDSRLAADDIAPYRTTVMFVGPTTPLSEMIADSVRWGETHGGSGMSLMIYCHGLPGYLQICKEGLQYNNLLKLKPLSPFFDGVSIHACLIAKGTAGRAFCTKMAQVLVCPVEGAVTLQGNSGPQTLYGWEDDEKYDGDYYVHDVAGGRTGPYRSIDVGPIIHPSLY